MYKEPIIAAPELDLTVVQRWHGSWAEIEHRIGPVFRRQDVRARALAYLTGLLSPAERKNSWQLAEICGHTTPYGLQHLLGRARWDAEALRDRLRTYVVEALADPEAVGVLDETGFLKKGTCSAGVARQYSGTAGRVANCQIGVFLGYASRHGHALLDRELYLPKEWTQDHERCRQAGIPDHRVFATKPVLARQMLERTFAAGVTLAWVTGDSVYGGNRALRRWLERRPQAYVLGISGNETIWMDGRPYRSATLLATLPADGWQRLSAGDGTKGPRWSDWLRLELSDPVPAGWTRWVLLRRNLGDPSECRAYIAFAPTATPLTELVRVEGLRWRVEESFQTAKGDVGLDHYEVRSWLGWYRHSTLAMWAQAFLVVVRAASDGSMPPKKSPRPETPRRRAYFASHQEFQFGSVVTRFAMSFGRSG